MSADFDFELVLAFDIAPCQFTFHRPLTPYFEGYISKRMTNLGAQPGKRNLHIHIFSESLFVHIVVQRGGSAGTEILANLASTCHMAYASQYWQALYPRDTSLKYNSRLAEALKLSNDSCLLPYLDKSYGPDKEKL